MKIVNNCGFILVLLLFYVGALININTHFVSLQLDVDIRFSTKQASYPIMFVAKTTEKTEVYVGEWFQVEIIVANIGNDTAYNITIIDSKYSPSTIRLKNYTHIYYVPLMKPNVSIILSYKACISKSAQGNYSLGIAKLLYYDESGARHEVMSQELIVKVKSRSYYIDKGTIYRQLTLALTVMILSTIISLTIIERRTLLEYQKRK